MVEISTLFTMFSDFLMSGIFGSPLITGIFVLMFFGYFALKTRIPLMDVGIVLIAPAIIILASTTNIGLGLLPQFLAPLVLFGLGVIIMLAILRGGRGQLG